jgi:DNA-binding MurR/RpiR family transcriptional regulator
LLSDRNDWNEHSRSKARAEMTMPLPPADFEAFRKALAEGRGALPPRLRQIAEFALLHPDDMAFGTAASIAARAEVQPSSLVRFAQQLGFSGFSQLQGIFRERLISGNHAERIERLAAARREGALRDPLQGFIESSMISLQRLAKAEIGDAVEAAAEHLAKARAIEIIGLRRAFSVASYLGYGLSKLGVRAHLIDGIGGFEPALPNAFDAQDALLAISFRPYTPQTIAVATAAADAGAPVIAITDTALSPLAALAKVRIDVAETDFSGFRSLAATFALASTLMTAIAEKRRA